MSATLNLLELLELVRQAVIRGDISQAQLAELSIAQPAQPAQPAALRVSNRAIIIPRAQPKPKKFTLAKFMIPNQTILNDEEDDLFQIY